MAKKLSVYVKHLAWLETAPDYEDKTQRPARYNSLAKESYYLIIPDADPYLVDCWNRLGRCESIGYGAMSLKWSEIDAFCNRSGRDLEPWQCDLLIDMSRDYCNALREAKDPNMPAPKLKLLSEDEQLFIQRKEVAAQLRAKRRKPA